MLDIKSIPSATGTLFFSAIPGAAALSFGSQISNRELYDKVLEEDIHMLGELKLKLVVVLLSTRELRTFKELASKLRNVAGEVAFYPIESHGTPDSIRDFSFVVKNVATTLQKGNALIMCLDGIERSGLLVAATLIQHRLPFKKAISFVKSKCSRTLSSKAQEHFLADFEKSIR